jgi:hypothetical protein
MDFIRLLSVSVALLGAAPVARAAAPASAKDSDSLSATANSANNPLARLIGVNIQNYSTPQWFGDPNLRTNALQLRVIAPVWRILPRLTLPVVTQRDANGDIRTGTGDLNVFVSFLLTKPNARFQAGLGPLYVAPTASFSTAGQGKHQLGAALILVGQSKRVLGGTLTTYQAAVAGDPTRPFVQTLIQQYFVILQVGEGWYLRSAPIWTFNLQTGDFNMPFGLGVGKVLAFDHVVVNMFIEPQATIAKYGDLTPGMQIFMGLNLQFPLPDREKRQARMAPPLAVSP